MTRGADNRQHLTGRNVQVKIVDHRRRTAGIVTEPHSFKTHFTSSFAHALRCSVVVDFRTRVEQQEDSLCRSRTRGIAFEQVRQLLQWPEEQEYIKQTLRDLAHGHIRLRQTVSAHQQQHCHASRAEQGGKGCEPAGPQAAADQCLIEVIQQTAIAPQVRGLLGTLLQHARSAHTLHQMRGEAAAVLRDLGPVALGDAFETPGRQHQQRHRGGEAQKEPWIDSPQHH
ncbi:hypothetical protein D3C81_1327900 [compost metagenome]